MNAASRLAVSAAALVAAVGMAAAASPSVLKIAEPGLWEIARTGAEPQRLCVANISSLAQLEHRRAPCTRVVIRESGTAATIHYTCAGSGFGESTITLVTPRSLRVQTQGISRNSPFNYTFQARRVGNCRGH